MKESQKHASHELIEPTDRQRRILHGCDEADGFSTSGVSPLSEPECVGPRGVGRGEGHLFVRNVSVCLGECPALSRPRTLRIIVCVCA